MAIEQGTEGLVVRLRSGGPGRYVGGLFLALWLCGWAVGETVALGVLVRGAWALLTGAPPGPGHAPLHLGPALLVGAFLVVWVTLWTAGGLAAISELLRLLWGDDRIEVASGRLTVTWGRGPLRWSQAFERGAIRGIALAGRDDHLSLATARERVVLSGLGSRAERIAAAEALRAALGVVADPPAATAKVPPPWEEILTPEGERALVTSPATRRVQARVAGVGTLLLAALTLTLARESVRQPGLIVLGCILSALTAGLGAAAVWLARGRWEWRLGSGRLTLRRRYGPDVRDVFEARSLLLERSTDGDGDPWYELAALTQATPPAPALTAVRWRRGQSKDRRCVARVMNDPTTVRDLGAWLSRETGLTLEDRTTPQARAVELAQLRDLLEQSGRFGRWAAKLVDRLDAGQRRAG